MQKAANKTFTLRASEIILNLVFKLRKRAQNRK